MSGVIDIRPIARRAFDRVHELLAPDPESPPDLAAYAAFWLRSQCDIRGASFLSPIVIARQGDDALHDLDLPSLSTQGFRLGAGLLRLDEAGALRLKVAVERVARRRPHTHELSGPADDPLCLLGLWLLASVVTPQMTATFESWIDVDALPPVLRVAYLLSGFAVTSHTLNLDTNSPQSLAANLLVSSAAKRPGVRVKAGGDLSHVVSQLVTFDVGGKLSRGGFDALAVLVALELIVQDAETAASAPHPSASSQIVAERRKVAILLVCANPHGTDLLRLGEEERALREALRLATHRERFTIEVLNAATIDDLRRALLRDSYGIVQFSGHASHHGLQFEDAVGNITEPDSDALAELLQRRGVQTVVLNACDSLSVGLAATARIEHTIAMTGPITDESAIEFSRGFYDALGEGLDVAGAFDEGVACCKLKRLPVSTVLLRKGERQAPRP